MSSDVAIRAEGLSKRYRIGATEGFARYRSLREDLTGLSARRRARRNSESKDFWALKDVSLEIRAGETVGIIGRNGAGKSTLLKILARITPPTAGRGETYGRVGSLLEVGTGFHPELTGRENIMLAAAIMGMRRAEVLASFDQIVDFSGLAKFLDTPVKRYSSGMYTRLAFSVAAHLDPEILLVDEVLAVGDAEFQRKCLGRMEELGGTGKTVLFVSHSMASVLRLCPRVILLDGGHVRADGTGTQVVEEYMGRGGGSAERTWDDAAGDAPGDGQIRLRSVRVMNQSGMLSPEVPIGEPVRIDVEYENLSDDPAFRPSVNLHFFNAQGTCLFVTWDANNMDWRARPRGRGIVRTSCHIPGHFFAEGGISVLTGISSLQPTTVHVRVEDSVGFHVTDPTQGDGVRGEWARDWPGVVRPMLAWEADYERESTRANDPIPTEAGS